MTAVKILCDVHSMEPALKVILIAAVAYVVLSLWRGSAAPPAREPFTSWIDQEFVTVPPTPFVVPRPPLYVSAGLTAAPTAAPTPSPTTAPVPVLTQVGADLPAVTPTLVPMEIPTNTPATEIPTLVTTHLASSPLMTA